MFIHLFTVRMSAFEDPSLDSLYHINKDNTLLMMDEQTYVAAQELSVIPQEITDERKSILSYISMTEIRLRYNNDMYPHILRLEYELKLDMEMLNEYIISFTIDELKDLFKKWKFK